MRKLFLVTLFVSSFFSAQETEIIPRKKDGYFLGSFHIGQGFRVAEVEKTGVTDVDNLQEELLSGRSLNFNLRYFIKSKRMAFGVKYNSYFTDDVSGIVRGKGSIDFFAATYGIFIPSESGLGILNLELGVGYLDYKTDVVINGVNQNGVFINSYKVSEEGGNLGISLAAGYDFKIIDNIYIGPHFEIIAGNLSEIKLNDNGKVTKMSLNNEQKISLTRIDLNAHLSIIF